MQSHVRQQISGGGGHLKASLWLLPLLACTAGCGSPKLSGKVTYNGELLRSGLVSITAANGWVGTSQINEDGTYSIANVPPGSAKIAVDNFSSDARSKPPRDIKHRPPRPAPTDTSVKIPVKYKKPETSGLTCEVTGGRQTHNIELK
jgi:hypothetical protein